MLLAGCGGGDDDGIPITLSLQVEVRTPSQVNLTWSAHPEAVTNYRVFRNDANAFTTKSPGSAVMDFNLNPDTRFCYVAHALVFPIGSVGRSNEACARTPRIASWRRQTVDATAVSAGPNSLVNDAANNLHLVYSRRDGIVYATNASGMWVGTKIADIARVFNPPAIALDPVGAVHISYTDPDNGTLIHATNASGLWINSTIDTHGFGSAIAVDSAGKIHVSYVRPGIAGSEHLSHASNQSGTWISEFVSGAATSGSKTALAIDSSNAAHIAYVAGSAVCAVRYATNASGAWIDNTVFDTNAGCVAGIALDASDKVHIVFMQSFDLKYATNASGSWSTISVDRLDWIGSPDVSIALDISGAVHIGYEDQNSDLKYVTNVTGSWKKLYVDAKGDVGSGNAVRMNSNGRVHITYYDTSNARLRHATDR